MCLVLIPKALVPPHSRGGEHQSSQTFSRPVTVEQPRMLLGGIVNTVYVNMRVVTVVFRKLKAASLFCGYSVSLSNVTRKLVAGLDPALTLTLP